MALSGILLSVVFWLLKSLSYWWIFRFRKISATLLTCLIIAGVPFLLTLLPVPSILLIPVGIGVAAYLTMHYTGVGLIPDGLFIPLGIEVAFWVAGWLIRESGLIG